MQNIDWKRIFIVGVTSIFWIEVVVVIIKAWPDGTIFNLDLIYYPEVISPASVVFVASLLAGFYYTSYTHNYLFLACVVWGIMGFWATFGLNTDDIFPDVVGPLQIFATLYLSAFMSRLTSSFFV